jgi:O-antigen ligase
MPLVVLVALVVLSPWPFGSVPPWAAQALSAIAIAATLLALALGSARRGLPLPAVLLWPLLGLLALGFAQLVPLDASPHALVGSGSYALWHPANPGAAAVLGPGPRPISIDPSATLRWLAFAGGLGLLGLVSAPGLADARRARIAAAVVVAGGLAVSTYGIFARARCGPLLYCRFAVPTVSPFGPFVSKNHFAGYVEMAALLAFGLALGLADEERSRPAGADARRSSGAVLALVSALAMALGVLVSSSRGGIFSLLAGGGALLALRLLAEARTPARGLGRALPALAVGLVIGTTLLAILPREVPERMRSLAGASFRLDTWRDSLRTAAASPLVGHGLGSFHDAFPRFKRGHGLIRVEHAENDYLELLVDGGVVGLGLALFAALAVFGLGLRGLDRSRPPSSRGLIMGALAGLVTLTAHSALDFNLRIPSNAALAAFLAALAASAAGTRVRASSTGIVAAAAVALALVLAALGLGRPAPVLGEAEREVRAAASSASPEVRALRLERATTALEALVRARPARTEPWLQLAWTRAIRGDWAAAEALARHALSLDPARPDLREQGERLLRSAPGVE